MHRAMPTDHPLTHRHPLRVAAVVLAIAATLSGCGRDADQTRATVSTSAAPGSAVSATGPASRPGASPNTTGGPADPPGSSAPTTSASPSVPSTLATSTTDGAAPNGIDPMPEAGTDERSALDPELGTALLSDVRVARHEGFDRVVFEFRNHVPGYRVGYVDKPVLSDGAGEPVPLRGSFALAVRMYPASGVDLGASGPGGYETIYGGPDRIDPGTPEITEVVRAGDFEAVLSWAIGTLDRVDFRVTTLTAPPRLVIDVRNR